MGKIVKVSLISKFRFSRPVWTAILPSSAQAQGQLETELALFSFDIAANPPHPPMKVYLAA